MPTIRPPTVVTMALWHSSDLDDGKWYKSNEIKMLNYMKDLIKVRKRSPLFHISEASDIQNVFDVFQLESGVLSIAIRNPKFLSGHSKAVFILNPHDKAIPVEFDDYFCLHFSTAGLIGKEVKVKNFLAVPNSLAIFTLD